MSRDSGGNRQRRTASQTAAVATGATALRSRRTGQVLGVIEFHVEALFELIGKSFARRIISVHVLVTDRAHRNILRCELREMTSSARFVSGETGADGIVRAAMTIIAAE
jgi:hypothetical protein